MSNITIIKRQTDLLTEAMSAHLAKGQAYALVDFPEYSNVGDSAIWIGARKVLESISGRPPGYICTHSSYDPNALRSAVGDAPIFIIGGGNFGNLYVAHQKFRFRLMQEHTASDIIQMSQSIAFKGDDGLAETVAHMRQHGRFRLYVRDKPSLAFAQEHLPCLTALAPDCAFGMGFLGRVAAPEGKFLFLQRTDTEVNGLNYDALMSLNPIVLDWVVEPSMPTGRLRLDAIKAAFPSMRINDYRAAILNAKAELRLARGLHILAKGRFVITDRLHGHILSVLSGIPNVAFDNSTGKVSGYHEQWMPHLEMHAVASSVDEALAAIVAIRNKEIDAERCPSAQV